MRNLKAFSLYFVFLISYNPNKSIPKMDSAMSILFKKWVCVFFLIELANFFLGVFSLALYHAWCLSNKVNVQHTYARFS